MKKNIKVNLVGLFFAVTLTPQILLAAQDYKAIFKYHNLNADCYG